MGSKSLVIGLIGGIGSGKSAVASLFQEYGAGVIDADALAHKLLDRPAVRRALVRAFGGEILRRRRIHRPSLARLAFANTASARRLNAIVHPPVGREIQKRINRLRKRKKLVVLEAALMLEAGSARLCDTLIYLEAPRALRQARVQRRGWPPGERQRRESVQWPLPKKKARADFVIRNSGTRTEMRRQVRDLLEKFLSPNQEVSWDRGRPRKKLLKKTKKRTRQKKPTKVR